MTAETNRTPHASPARRAGEARGVRGGGQSPRDRGVPGGRPPGPALRLLTAAEELFGERSYHRTTIADICARAGMATGSFYSYFGSKAEIFAAVVRAINTDLRRSMREALDQADGGQRANERASFRAYFDMLSTRPWIERIIRESEFIDPSLFREYYENLTRGYARGVRAAQLAREVDARYDPEVIAFAYTGIGNFVGMRWAEWTAGGSVPDDVLDDILELLRRGLPPEAPAAPEAPEAPEAPRT
jgi:AcrR family transcriptional regulator